MSIHDASDLQNVLGTLSKVEELEKTVSDLYKLCAEKCPADSHF